MGAQCVRAQLISERVATAARIDAMTADLAALMAASAGSNLDDEHDPEGSTVAFEREQFAALRAQAEAHLDEIEAALARLAAGRYGVCESCGGEIANERLATLPAARLCVTCAAQRDR